MGDCFIEKIKVLDSWRQHSTRYRLVYKGAGPVVLQKKEGKLWVDERSCYTWGVVVNRLVSLKKQVNK